jgi:methionine-S-sulfoxide reductase
VTRTRVGYTGGTLENPSYEDVCSHTTGHAEVVEVTYDPERVSYEQLLDVFWGKHDPTQVNRQGCTPSTGERSPTRDEGSSKPIRSTRANQPTTIFPLPSPERRTFISIH